jgi:deazaflavin-dependent oxidoreductase (nitroreductase family)
VTLRRLSLAAVLPAVLFVFVMLVRFRPRSMARFNRVATNRLTRRFAGRAPGFGIVIHRGRRTGRVYRTPVNVFAVPGGFLIALTYGRTSEWVRNVLLEGGGALETRGRTYRFAGPTIVHDPSHRRIPAVLRPIPRLGGVTDYLRVSVAEEPAAGSAASI